MITEERKRELHEIAFQLADAIIEEQEQERIQNSIKIEDSALSARNVTPIQPINSNKEDK